MSLDELIELLKQAKEQASQDVPVRIVLRVGSEGRQYELLDAQLHDGLHGPIVLQMAGQEVATMEWPASTELSNYAASHRPRSSP